ncbi:MAG: RAMP superfamily protein [Ardenticatenaceae bacterium]|nr:RAMP superfamily protein [Ardenticatenaceae bacterium]
MTSYWLEIKLESDTAPGRGDGVAGLVNAEVQHEPSGLPFLGGKTLKGLLTATCGEILYALDQSQALGSWDKVAKNIFGQPGSKRSARGKLHVGGAFLPDDLRQAVAEDIANKQVTREEILESITVMRRQTAMDAERGTPLDQSLRTIRVVLRETIFTARLDFLTEPTNEELALLSACIKGLRRIGTNRNRGMGRVSCTLFADEVKKMPVAISLADHFKNQEVSA